MPTYGWAVAGPRRSPTGERDVRERIVGALDRLLRARPFDELAVADVLAEAQVSRSSFYFYFAGKHEVLAELVRRATDVGVDAAGTWQDLGPGDDAEQAVRASIAAGAVLWREQAHVLRAIVESWRHDPALGELWAGLMDRFTRLTLDKLEADRREGLTRDDAGDPARVAAALTWLGERLYYLAAIEQSPFDDEEALVDTLTTIWLNTLYRR